MPSDFEQSAGDLATGLQRPASAPETPDAGLVGGPCKCGAAQSLVDPDRCVSGHVWRGRPSPALTMALKSETIRAGRTAEAAAALKERIEEIITHLGGRETLSALAIGQVERHARLEMVDEHLWQNIEAEGVLSGKGRQRAALTAWLSVIDRLQRSAVALGLERRSKHVNPLDAVRAAVIEANKRNPSPEEK